MQDKNSLLRLIPKMDTILAHPLFLNIQGSVLTQVARSVTNSLREAVLSGEVTSAISLDDICDKINIKLEFDSRHSLHSVINATGVVLHTNLGRACLPIQAVEALTDISSGYSTLEYDVATGQRGSRHSHVEEVICRLTGAEAAMAVNNNAAAVLLVLSAMTKGKEVILSRGELVEIGGSFRVPEVMEQGGAILREVGTTNKTHLFDYENAINENTGALLKVHTSNYKITGFTKSIGLEELVSLGQKYKIPVIEDLGSGLLINPERLGLIEEPFVQKSVSCGADVITFSGDKLLGGPQAGIIIGKKEYIDIIKAHPLARAVRIDKLTLAALEATLRCYLDTEVAVKSIPTIRMLLQSKEELNKKASRLLNMLKNNKVHAEVLRDLGQVGGGSAPDHRIQSYAVAVDSKTLSAIELEKALRLSEHSIITHIFKDRVLINVLTLSDDELVIISDTLSVLLSGERE